MTEEKPAATTSAPSLWTALVEVIKELRGQYPLLFGLGAGLVLLAVLGVTGNVTALVVVAAVLVLSLIAWIAWRLPKKWKVLVEQSQLTRSPVGTSKGAIPEGGREVTVRNTTATDSPIGTHEGP